MKILVLNSGSSSQKSSLYEIGPDLPASPPVPLWEGKIEWHGDDAETRVHTSHGATLESRVKVASRAQAIEPLLDGARALALRRAGAIRPLSECLAAVGSEQGRGRLREYLHARPFPHYEPAPDAPDLLVRVDEDGTRTVGRFVGRTFQAVQ